MTTESNPSYASRDDQLQAEWSPKNVKSLDEYTRGSGFKALWVCRLGHEWETSVVKRYKGNNCPFCGNKHVLAGFNDLGTTHPSVAKEWHPAKNLPLAPTMVTGGSDKKVWWQCEKGHEWEAAVYERAGVRRKATGCPFCSGNRVISGVTDLASTHPELVKEWSPKNVLKPNGVSAGSETKVGWICPKGHEYESRIYSRTSKTSPRGCPICAGRSIQINKERLRLEWSPLNVGTTPDDYTPGSGKKVWWQCLAYPGEHPDYEQPYGEHVKGRGCPKCGYLKRKETRVANKFAKHGSLAQSHPELALDWDSSKNKLTPDEVHQGQVMDVAWKCHTCSHEWQTTLLSRTHMRTGCPRCWNLRRKGLKQTPTERTFSNDYPQLVEVWSDKNQYSHTEVKPSSAYKAWWKCPSGIHPEYQRTCYDQTSKLLDSGCPKCNLSRVSKAEIDLDGYIRSLGVTTITGSRKVIPPFELDIYIPEKNVAIEYNGLYWHTESQGKDKWYHHKKWAACKEKGIQLIQIWEDDWNRNPDLVKKMIAHKLGVASTVRAYARKCKVVRLSKGATSAFLNANHIQGSAEGSVRYGLEFEGAVVAVMVLKSEPGSGGKGLNLLRFATSMTVPGGFTKLLRSVLADYPEVTEVVTFSDNCVSDGGLYENNGFVAVKQLAPDYMYLVGNQRRHKFGYRLVKFRTDPGLQYVEGLSESQLAELNGLERVWDAGKTKWVLSRLVL